MPKGYPKTRFDIIDQTQIQEIKIDAVPNPTAVIMATYTSDKGSEDWELMYGLTNFTETKGGISFTKHGQAQLLVAEVLRNGGYVLGKRMVCSNAKLANLTFKVRLVEDNNVLYVYPYAISAKNVGNLNDAAADGYQYQSTDYDYTDTGVMDFPLFTITAKGRGISNASVRIVPEYSTSKSSTVIKYSCEVWENNVLIESIVFTINPDIIINDISQSIQAKIADNSQQINCKMFEDGIFGLARKMAEFAKQYKYKLNGDIVYSNSGAPEATDLTVQDLINLDFINGLDRRGNNPFGNVVTYANTEIPSNYSTTSDAYQRLTQQRNLWKTNMPDDLYYDDADYDEGTGRTNKVYPVDGTMFMPLLNGSFGDMGSAPAQNFDLYKNMLMAAWGKHNTLTGAAATAVEGLYDPIIYDLDAFKPDAVIDCGFPYEVKNAIIDVCDFRGDMVFLADLCDFFPASSVETGSVDPNQLNGMPNTLDKIIESSLNINSSRYCAVYHNYFNIIDPYTKKEITVTMPYLLAKRLVKHVSKGIGRPFAGLSNNIYFPEIVPGTINFLPVTVPGEDQKQKIVDAAVNYISIYDGTPVMETMYTNNDEYTQLSYLHNILAIQEVIKVIRSRCPRTRYTFLDGDDLEEYLADAEAVIKQYSTNFRSISIQYMADERYEANNIFYATIVVQFRNFIQEEYFQVIAIS